MSKAQAADASYLPNNALSSATTAGSVTQNAGLPNLSLKLVTNALSNMASKYKKSTEVRYTGNISEPLKDEEVQTASGIRDTALESNKPVQPETSGFLQRKGYLMKESKFAGILGYNEGYNEKLAFPMEANGITGDAPVKEVMKPVADKTVAPKAKPATNMEANGETGDFVSKNMQNLPAEGQKPFKPIGRLKATKQVGNKTVGILQKTSAEHSFSNMLTEDSAPIVQTAAGAGSGAILAKLMGHPLHFPARGARPAVSVGLTPKGGAAIGGLSAMGIAILTAIIGGGAGHLSGKRTRAEQDISDKKSHAASNLLIPGVGSFRSVKRFQSSY